MDYEKIQNAVDQKNRRERISGAGKKRKDLWVTKDDGILSEKYNDKLPTMTIEDLKDKLQNELHFNGSDLEAVYNELFEYAKIMGKRLRKILYGDENIADSKLRKLRNKQ